MIVNVRTHDDLRELLKNRQSGNWKISAGSQLKITKVRVFNWDVDQVLIGDFSPAFSLRDVNNDLIIGISNCRIENFRSNEKWSAIFGTASVAYTPNVSIQISKQRTFGILRDANFDSMSKRDVDEFFRRLINEIRLRGIKTIVFKSGGITIPDFFINWCKENNVSIEILDEEKMGSNYPIIKDVFWEDDLSPRIKFED